MFGLTCAAHHRYLVTDKVAKFSPCPLFYPCSWRMQNSAQQWLCYSLILFRKIFFARFASGLGLSHFWLFFLDCTCVPWLAPATDPFHFASRWRLSQTLTLRTGAGESSTPLVYRWKRTRGRSQWGAFRLPWGSRVVRAH